MESNRVPDKELSFIDLVLELLHRLFCVFFLLLGIVRFVDQANVEVEVGGELGAVRLKLGVVHVEVVHGDTARAVNQRQGVCEGLIVAGLVPFSVQSDLLHCLWLMSGQGQIIKGDTAVSHRHKVEVIAEAKRVFEDLVRFRILEVDLVNVIRGNKKYGELRWRGLKSDRLLGWVHGY